MTVKRLADNQDINFKFDNKDLKFLNSLLENYPKDKKQSAVVPSLFYAQRKAGGWLPEKAILAVSDFLDMPKIRVLEIATFYSMFNLQQVVTTLFKSVEQLLAGLEELKISRRRVKTILVKSVKFLKMVFVG